MDFSRIKQVFPLFKHLVYTVGLGVILVLLFFYVLLPGMTNHGETITVPNIKNQHIDDLDDILLTRSLRFEVNEDSSYTEEQEPLTVIDQFPLPNAKVKENRKIYITLNARRPPLVSLPDFQDKSLKHLRNRFEALGLKEKIVEYRPVIGFMTILEASYNGKQLEAGDLVPQGATIELVIANGLGSENFAIPDMLNKPLDEAKILILAYGLQMGQMIKVDSPFIEIIEEDSTKEVIEVPEGYVVRQRPNMGDSALAGDFVDLWYYQVRDTLRSDDVVIEDER